MPGEARYFAGPDGAVTVSIEKGVPRPVRPDSPFDHVELGDSCAVPNTPELLQWVKSAPPATASSGSVRSISLGRNAIPA